MNIQQAITEVRSLIAFIGGAAFESREPTLREIGDYTNNCYSAITYLVEFAQTMANVPTDHDARAEMESWDQFFEDIKKVVK